MKQTLKTMLALLALAIPSSLCAKTVYVYGTNSQKSMTVSSVRHVTFENGKLNLVHHDGSIEQTNLSSTRIFTLRDLGTTAVDEISGDKNANASIKSYDNNVFVFASTRIEKVDIYDAAGRLAATVAPNHTEASLLLPGHGFYVCRVLTADGSVSIRKIAL